MTSQYRPRISVVTSVFNGEKYLSETIESVLNQTYTDIEYIIIDGGSKDSSLSIIKKYESRIHRWVSEPDKGIYDAWNKALKFISGEWVCFIGADDFFLDNMVIENVIGQLEGFLRENKKFIYGKVVQFSEDKLSTIEVLGKSWEDSRKGFSQLMTLPHCGALTHRSLFDENGDFNIKFKIAGDYEFLLRQFVKNQNFAAFINHPIVGMRSGGISARLSNRLAMAKETNAARKLNGLNRISIPIVMWIFRIRIYMILDFIFGAKLSMRLADLYRLLKGQKKRWSA